jgi:hypothetical protein
MQQRWSAVTPSLLLRTLSISVDTGGLESDELQSSIGHVGGLLHP